MSEKLKRVEELGDEWVNGETIQEMMRVAHDRFPEILTCAKDGWKKVEKLEKQMEFVSNYIEEAHCNCKMILDDNQLSENSKRLIELAIHFLCTVIMQLSKLLKESKER